MQTSDPLEGHWITSDGLSSVVVTISRDSDQYQVSVVDHADEETAEVYDVQYAEETLFFNVHWPSNGHFIKYRFTLLSEDRISVTYTFSGQETWSKIEI